MPAFVSRRPLLLALFAGIPATALAAPETQDGVAARSIELTADTLGQELAVRISPNRTTSLVFDTPLLVGGVRVEQREHFRSVTVDEAAGLITLLPSGELPAEEQLSLTVRFVDDAVPESVTIQLVPHPNGAEPQVQVFRQARSAESYKQEARREHERAERCESELKRTRAEQRSPGGLVGLFELGLMGRGKVVAVRDVFAFIPQRPDNPFKVRSAFSYRAEQWKRVAVELELDNLSSQPWKMEKAELVGPKGARPRVLRVWPLEFLAAGEMRRVVVEAEAQEEDTRGAFILKLTEAGGSRTLTFRGVTFP
jgi:uncharacterized protein (TIGR02268 family)